MKSRKLHKIVGLLLVLPMFGWTITGIIFFIKPGYQGAYEQLSVKLYPLASAVAIPANIDWHEVKVVHSILGEHLLVKTVNGSSHLDPKTLMMKKEPNEVGFKRLLVDAFANNPERYGNITDVDGLSAKTSTGVEVKLDWNNFRLSQKGNDTQLINALYKIHYLQWTPNKAFNQFLGIFGLILLALLTVLGIRVYLKK